jgi:FkbM family methyltransferase
MALRAASAMVYFTSPKNVLAMSKYMYIKNLIQNYGIDLILDVGANVGKFATSMREIGYKGDIISFEPVATVFEKLSIAAAGDPKWKACNFALGQVSGKHEINIMRKSEFSSFRTPTLNETTQFASENTVLRTEIVETWRLEDIAPQLGIRDRLGRCFLKCDTQGFDIDVLKGSENLLTQIRMLQIELSVTRLYQATPGMIEMLQFLEERLFSPVAFFPVTRLPNWSALEFDYLGVNTIAASSEPS